MPDHPTYHTPIILPDNPLRDEDQAYFHFDQYAATLARLIANKHTQTPLTIGVSGSWGSGKTTLLRRLERQLKQTKALLQRTKPALFDFCNPDEDPNDYRVCRTVWFDAWKYANEDALLVALVRVIVQEMFRDDFISKLAAAFWEPFTPRRNVIDTVLGWFSIKTPFGEVGLDTGEAKPTPLAEKTALLDLFDDAFEKLMAAWVHHKTDVQKIDPEKGVLVVFIDDLDRCLPAKAIQVLEAVKLFLDKEGCVFVLGADVALIQQAVEAHYKEIKGQKADDYLEKVIQLRFSLPQIGKGDLQSYLSGQNIHEIMRTRWQALVAAAEANPRRVKAVVNDLELLWRMLENMDQTAGVNRDDFICWQALMRAAPASFRKEFNDLPEDPGGLELRHQFILGALQWMCGTEEEKAAVRAPYDEKYRGDDSKRLRDVLREIIQFSAEFNAVMLNAIVHLAALPHQEPPPAGEQPAVLVEQLAESPLEAPEVSPKGAVARGEPAGVVIREFAGIEFCRIPKGAFVLGSTDDNQLAFDDEKPRHTFTIEQDYWLGRTPVTNAQFRAFVQATPYRTTAEEKGSAWGYDGKEWKEIKGANWQRPRGPQSSLDGKDDHPVVSVSWLDALAYCRWLEQAHESELPAGCHFRLPTEAEWEKASRDPRGSREWPWGNEEPDGKRCNFNMNVKDTTPVGIYSPQGDSPYGCADMAGNVWEWTHTAWANYPYALDEREQEDETQPRVLRGGSFNYSHRYVRCAYRLSSDPDYRGNDLGFRVVVSPTRP